MQWWLNFQNYLLKNWTIVKNVHYFTFLFRTKRALMSRVLNFAKTKKKRANVRKQAYRKYAWKLVTHAQILTTVSRSSYELLLDGDFAIRSSYFTYFKYFQIYQKHFRFRKLKLILKPFSDYYQKLWILIRKIFILFHMQKSHYSLTITIKLNLVLN